jgi:hypothetical protein
LGVPAFACTPDLFPELMTAASSGRDLRQWASSGSSSERPLTAEGGLRSQDSSPRSISAVQGRRSARVSLPGAIGN